MAKTMLIDATHPEETRVAVVDGKKLEEFDVEIAGRRPLKGNIYLAKVTRVEPSLQACFVEYGGNRHGFLAFSEIHPDYYRIPIADREALIRETQAALEPEHEERPKRSRRHRGARRVEAPTEESADETAEHHHHEQAEGDDHHHDDHAAADHAEGDHDHGESDSVFDSPDDALPEGETRLEGAADHQPTDEPDGDQTMPLLARQEVLRQDPAEAEGAPTEAPSSDYFQHADAPTSSGDTDLPPRLGELVEVAAPDEVLLDTSGGSEPAANDDPEVDEENARRRRQRALRRYKIQEVIKRRQILLIQVTKEERGNKGAALTTYLSLAGRYSVLMPNTDRGGGISRRITSVNDRKRLKGIVDDLDVPEGMAVIVRTAGSERSKPEVKRDFEYLMRLWDEIRETTLKSSAPALIYEEASLIKRSIRDLYTREMGDIVVAGTEGYSSAKAFMRMLTPSHAKRVQFYRDPSIPLFQRYQVESQLAAIHNPTVHLRSGGYIVINQTEALVAIDVNSGRSTKERNIEETATKTNAEAAEEIARQLRLRDLAGLIVIDFIDMEESRNNNAVERRMKDSLRNDRARIQIGRISSFGLLEMSRQRLHPSLQEASTDICPHCRGSGRIRSVDSTALHVLRLVEEEITKSFSPGVAVFAPTAVALYILNQKRTALSQLEARRGVRIYLNSDDSLVPPDFRLERIKQLAPGEELPPAPDPMPLPTEAEIDLEDDVVEETEAESEDEAEGAVEADGETETAEAGTAASGDEEQSGRGRGRRRRRRRGRSNRFSADEFTESSDQSGGETPSAPDAASHSEEPAGETPMAAAEAGEAQAADDDGDEAEGDEATSGGDDQTRRRRRRGRRGGRRRSRRGPDEAQGSGSGESQGEPQGEFDQPEGNGEQPAMPEDSDALPPQWRQPSAPATEHVAPAYTPEPAPLPVAARSNDREDNRGEEAERASSAITVIEIGESADQSVVRTVEPEESSDQSRRRGWWRRLIE